MSMIIIKNLYKPSNRCGQMIRIEGFALVTINAIDIAGVYYKKYYTRGNIYADS